MEDDDKPPKDDDKPPKWSYLHHDLIEKLIKSNLPIRTYYGLSCVNQSYASVLSDPAFAKMYLDVILSAAVNKKILVANQNFSEFFCINPITATVESVYQPPSFGDMMCSSILGSCNGILCLGYKNSDQSRYTLVLWNPSLGHRMVGAHRMVGNFECAPINWFGFGCDSQSNEYKFVDISTAGRNPTVRVYHLSTGSVSSFRLSRDLGEFLPNGGDIPFRSCTVGTYFGGELYWLTMHPTEVFFQIVVFNLKTDSFKLLQLPYVGYDPVVELGSLCGSGDKVRVFVNNPNKELTMLSLVKDDNSDISWTVTRFAHPDGIWDVPLGFINDILLVRKMHNYPEYEIVLYMEDNQSLRSVTINSRSQGQMVYKNFVETLIKP